MNNKTDLTGLNEITEDLNKLESAFIDATELFAHVDLVKEWKNSAMLKHAIDTGAYVDAVEVIGILSGDALRDFVLGNDVGYAGIVERGRSDRPNYKPKNVALAALDYVDAQDVFEDRLTNRMDKILSGKK